MLVVRRAAGSIIAVSLALLVPGSSDAAAAKRITGKLSKPGYSVMALGVSREAEVVRASPRSFTLRPPARRVTLHLRGPDGTYAGPIVVGRTKKGKRAIVGVRAGARLGGISIRRSYAKPAKEPARRFVDADRTARARKGVPIGAGNFGRVRAPARKGLPGDLDRDGVPDPLDIDDDGDLVLDALERPTSPRPAQVAPGFGVAANLSLPLEQTVNANVPGITMDDIDVALKGPGGNLAFGSLPSDPAELDCGGLVYCSAGGTGRVGGRPFPGPPLDPCCFDPDGDGFGTLAPDPPGQPGMFLDHGAGTDQIGTGDVLVARVTSGGEESELLHTLGFVSTVPALVSYDDDGPGGRQPTGVGYPVAPGGPGTPGNGFLVHPRDDPCSDPAFCEAGDVVLTLTFWRAQRLPIGTGENREACLDETPPCAWIDIGQGTYGADLGSGQGACPEQGAYSTTDENLIPKSSSPGGFTDLAEDRPADPAKAFTYTLNVTRCLASGGATWSSGEKGFAFKGFAPGSSGFSEQSAVFRLP